MGDEPECGESYKKTPRRAFLTILGGPIGEGDVCLR